MRKFIVALALLLLPIEASAQTKKIEVYSNGAKVHEKDTDATTIWMRGDGYKDLGTFSTQGGVAPPPPTSPGTGLPKPTTAEEWRATVQAALDGCYVVRLDPTTTIKPTGTILLTAKDCGQNRRGFDGAGNIEWEGNDFSQDVVRVVSSASARGLFFRGLNIYGGGYAGKGSRDCFTVVVDAGGRPIYKFLLQDIYTDYCGRHGVSLFGDVYEGALYNIHAENHSTNGIHIEHLPGNLIISNIYIVGLNSSRNKGYALRLGPNTTSVQVSQFSFVNNHLGGILAPGGMRNVESGNCENSGPICVDMPSSIYTSRIVGVEASTDNNVQGSSAGSGPMKHLYRYGSGGTLNQRDNSIVCYGASCTGVQLKAP